MTTLDAKTLLDNHTRDMFNAGEAMDAREWPEGAARPIMPDWQRPRLAQYKEAREALEKEAPTLAQRVVELETAGRRFLASFDGAESAELRAFESALANQEAHA